MKGSRLHDLFRSCASWWKLVRSGIFDGVEYLSANQDALSFPLGPTAHYCFFGQYEERNIAQSAATTWLLPYLLKNQNLWPNRAAKLHRLAREAETSGDMSRLKTVLNGTDENLAELQYHIAYERNEFEKAAQWLASTDDSWSFLYRYRHAKKHLHLTDFPDAVRRAIDRLGCDSTLTTPHYVAIREGLEFALTPDQAMHEVNGLLLDSFAKACPVRESDIQSALWRIGFPIISDGSELFQEIAELIPDRLAKSVTKFPGNISSIGKLWRHVLNSQTLNMLKPDSLQVIGSEANFAIENASSNARTCIEFRGLGPGYWKAKLENTVNQRVLSAWKALVLKAMEHGSGIVAIPGSQIYDLRQLPARDNLNISYHTISAPEQNILNFKESPLPDYFLLDRAGFSGWATNPTITHHSPAAEVFFDDVSRQYNEERVSKYAQPTSSLSTPRAKPYLLFALQVPDDTVAALVKFDIFEAIEISAKSPAADNMELVVKPHPKDDSIRTRQRLQRLTESYANIIATDDAIFDLIQDADAVITANSGVGFEALLYLKPVITLAMSDYAACTILAEDENSFSKALTVYKSRLNTVEHSQRVKSFVFNYLHQRSIRPSLNMRPFETWLEKFYEDGQPSNQS